MKLAILGVGLIGGSIGLAAKENLGAEVAGFDPDPETLGAAVEVGALDRPAGSVAEAVEGAEAIFCAAPVRALPELALAALEASDDGAVVTDVGSTKQGLLDALSGSPAADRFIGGHPLAGAETDGVRNSRADLFDGARWYLTPTPNSQGILYERLQTLIGGLGARPQALDPAEHDRAMATISHLPHVVSNALASRAVEALGSGDRRPEVGGSFRDATRVAGANPAMWGDIFSANAPFVADEVDALIERLTEASALLREADPDRLRAWQAEAAAARHELLDTGHPAGDLVELRLTVENRPGVVAEIALALGKAGVNIEDMSLAPAADHSTGSISLWLAAESVARAGEVVAGLGHRYSVVREGS